MRFSAESAIHDGVSAFSASDSDAVVRRLSVENLTIMAGTNTLQCPVVSDLSFQLAAGEIAALAGESGSGKSLTSLAIMGLLPKPATRMTAGVIRLGDEVI